MSNEQQRKLQELVDGDERISLTGDGIWIYHSGAKYARLMKWFRPDSITLEEDINDAIAVGQIAAKIKEALSER